MKLNFRDFLYNLYLTLPKNTLSMSDESWSFSKTFKTCPEIARMHISLLDIFTLEIAHMRC